MPLVIDIVFHLSSPNQDRAIGKSFEQVWREGSVVGWKGEDNLRLTVFASKTLSNMGIRLGIWTSTVAEGITSVSIKRRKRSKAPDLLERPAYKNAHLCNKKGHTSVTRQVDRGNRMTTLSDSFSHSSYVRSSHDLNAWEYAEVLAQGKKMTRHWPKMEMFKSYECPSPVYQTESSAFPNRVFSFHASIFCTTCTEKTTVNVLEGSTVYCTRETIHFSCSHLHQCPSGLHW